GAILHRGALAASCSRVPTEKGPTMTKPLIAVMLQEDEYQTYVVPRATFTFIPMNYQRRLQEVFNIIGGRAWPRRGRAGGEFNSIRGWSGRCPRLRGNFSSQCGLVGKTPRQCEEHRRLCL